MRLYGPCYNFEMDLLSTSLLEPSDEAKNMANVKDRIRTPQSQNQSKRESCWDTTRVRKSFRCVWTFFIQARKRSAFPAQMFYFLFYFSLLVSQRPLRKALLRLLHLHFLGITSHSLSSISFPRAELNNNSSSIKQKIQQDARFVCEVCAGGEGVGQWRKAGR